VIVKLNYESGAEMETSIPHDDGRSPVEIARGPLTVILGVTRVSVWDDGRGFSDPPSADETRDAADRPVPVDEALPMAREAPAEWLGEGVGSAVDGLGPALESSKWERWHPGASQVMATAQRSDGFPPPV
jgi:hypothetical protein